MHIAASVSLQQIGFCPFSKNAEAYRIQRGNFWTMSVTWFQLLGLLYHYHLFLDIWFVEFLQAWIEVISPSFHLEEIFWSVTCLSHRISSVYTTQFSSFFSLPSFLDMALSCTLILSWTHKLSNTFEFLCYVSFHIFFHIFNKLFCQIFLACLIIVSSLTCWNLCSLLVS